jgi:lysine 6-dehydrogenase
LFIAYGEASMEILVLGAGRMGSASAMDLARSRDVKRVCIADIDSARGERASAWIDNDKVIFEEVDVTDFKNVRALMSEFDAIISAVPFIHNFMLAKASVEAGTHFCDLGGNSEIVDKELELDSKARDAGITIIPDCGLAPGITNILAAHGANKLERVDEIHIRVGGLPLHPRGPLNYTLVFSAHGLLNEYTGRARVIRNGKITELEAMTGLETVRFPEPFGTLEAFHTAGGASTLPLTFKGKVKELDYKTLRYPGHCEKFKMLLDLGLASETPVDICGHLVSPRDVLAKVLEKNIAYEDDTEDVVLLRVSLTGKSNGIEKHIVYEMIDYHDARKSGLTAMMRTTAFPASIIAQMQVRGDIKNKGAFPPELCVPPEPFIAELRARDIKITETIR